MRGLRGIHDFPAIFFELAQMKRVGVLQKTDFYLPC
jgi:hypothetical protein